MGTFGRTTIGGTAWYLNRNYLIGLIAQSPADAEGATVSKISFYVGDDTNGNIKGILVKKSDLTILPNGIGDPVNVTGDGWYDSVFSTPPTISANTDYVISLIAETDINRWYKDWSANAGYEDASNNYAAPTNPTDAAAWSYNASIYATYTPSVGVAAPLKWTPHAALCLPLKKQFPSWKNRFPQLNPRRV